MAVTRKSPSKSILPSKSETQIKKKKEKKNKKKKEKIPDDSDQTVLQPSAPSLPHSSPPKRSKCPGVRIIGGRIYDSENGKCCHQCRQKTMDFVATCKNLKSIKPCTMSFCHKCLWNRYGEKAEEVALLDEWNCPKCKGICNCSFCMKKRGHKPTGILVHAAKGNGFSSVSQMLLIDGADKVSASPKKECGSSKGDIVAVSKCGEEGNTKKVPKGKRKNSEKNNINAGNNSDNLGEEINGHYDQIGKDEDEKDDVVKMKKLKKYQISTETIEEEHKVADIPLPQGVYLKTVAGIDIPSEDIGHALQFLEFCNAFGQVLDLKKGHSESILQGLSGCGRLRGQNLSVIQFHIQLLTLIHKDLGEESTLSPSCSGNSWLKALGKCVSEYNCPLKDLPSDCFDTNGEGYKKLDPSQKLRLLLFLCDETLETTVMRNWIDEVQEKFAKQQKDAKGKVTAAKEKARELKRKMQDKVAKAILARNGAPLSVSEHEKLISKIKAEASKAHEEKLQVIGMVQKEEHRSDAVRTNPILFDGDGHAFWTLGGYSSESHYLLQDIGSRDPGMHQEKWFSYEDEKKNEVEDYISFVRMTKPQDQSC